MNIIKVRFRSKEEFLEHYNDELPHGGLFCPTTTAFSENDEAVVELNCEGLPNKVMIRGRVVWWRSALPRLRVRAGALIAFDEDEEEKRNFVLDVMAGTREAAVRRKHARLPINLPVRWRTSDSSEMRESDISEISVGGALLQTELPLELGTEVILELKPPGGSAPVAIAGKVTYHAAGSGSGIKFLYRDGGGSRRIREVIRRIRADG